MAVTNLTTRQNPLVALVELTTSTVGAGNAVTVKLPPGAFMHDLVAGIAVAFDTAGTGTMTLSASDGTTTFISAENAKASANTAIAVDLRTKFFPSGGTLTFTLTETLDTTAATVGRIFAAVVYSIRSRATEVQE